jgi:hypothetical protein
MLKQHLQAQTYPQDGHPLIRHLTESLIQSELPQSLHRLGRRAHAGENDRARLPYDLGVGANQGRSTRVFHGAGDTAQIPGIIIHDYQHRLG